MGLLSVNDYKQNKSNGAICSSLAWLGAEISVHFRILPRYIVKINVICWAIGPMTRVSVFNVYQFLTHLGAYLDPPLILDPP